MTAYAQPSISFGPVQASTKMQESGAARRKKSRKNRVLLNQKTCNYEKDPSVAPATRRALNRRGS